MKKVTKVSHHYEYYHQFIALSFLFFSVSIKLQAQEDQNFSPPKEPPVVTAHLSTNHIKIDGKLNEPDWQQAQVIKDFFKMEPRQGGSYLYDT